MRGCLNLGMLQKNRTHASYFRNSDIFPLVYRVRVGWDSGMSFSLRQIQFFIAVADNGSISRAAGILSISQSTITEGIKEMERDLGIKLLERRSRGVALTEKGYLFRRYAERIWLDVTDARRALASEATSVSGRLTIGVTSLVAGYGLSELLARFQRRHPEITVDVVEDTHDFLEHLLLNGEVDISVLTVSQLSNPDALSLAVLDEHSYRVWLPAGHALAAQASVAFRQILSEPYIQLKVDEIEEASQRIWRKLGGLPKVVFRTQSVEAVRSLVATGFGLTILPDAVFRAWSLEGHRLEARTVIDLDQTLKVAVVWRRGAAMTQESRRFLDVAIDRSDGQKQR